jgi:hypothetical protein
VCAQVTPLSVLDASEDRPSARPQLGRARNQRHP